MAGIWWVGSLPWCLWGIRQCCWTWQMSQKAGIHMELGRRKNSLCNGCFGKAPWAITLVDVGFRIINHPRKTQSMGGCVLSMCGLQMELLFTIAAVKWEQKLSSDESTMQASFSESTRTNKITSVLKCENYSKIFISPIQKNYR